MPVREIDRMKSNGPHPEMRAARQSDDRSVQSTRLIRPSTLGATVPRWMT